MQAINHLPMGNFKKILLHFDAPIFPAAASQNIYPFSNDEQNVWRFITREPHANCITVIVGGVLATVLDGVGDDAVVAQAIHHINTMIGHDVTGALQNSSVTHWGTDPHFRGAYTYGLPGSENARHGVADADMGELWFAGEAYIEEAYATAHGAYDSGIRAATRALAEVLV